MASSRSALARGAALVGALVLLAAFGAWMLQSTIPRKIVIASGPQEGLYYVFAQRYRAILARDGVTLEVLPFFFATFVERLVILLVPLLVVIVPLVNLLPQLLRWRIRSRVYRWYGELALLERDVASRTGELPIDEWLAKIDRIEGGAARIKTPTRYASEAYTLREHIALVRRSILAKSKERRDVELAVS